VAEVVRSRALRIFFIAAGWLSLALGVIGIVTPILPTTPFVLLSAYCFARGSERFHDWLLAHKMFGPMVRAFRDEKRIPLKVKIFATVMIVVTMTVTLIWVNKLIVAAILPVTGLAVIIYIWTFKN